MSTSVTLKMPTNSAGKAMLELKLLDSLRGSNFEELKKLLDTDFNDFDKDSKDLKNLVLHYAVQVANLDLIEQIVSSRNGEGSSKIITDINLQDKDGNTPLHLAAAQSRGDVVNYLMNQPDINDCIRNKANLQAVDVCKDLNVVQTMQLKRSKYVQQMSEVLKDAARKKDFKKIDKIFDLPRNKELLNLNGIDSSTGENIFHEYAKLGDVDVCRWLLKNGANPSITNSRGQTVYDIVNHLKPTESLKYENILELKRLLEENAKEKTVLDMTHSLKEAPTYQGYLKKFTNFAKGFKVRWFVLTSDGKLSYYKNQDDAKNRARNSLNLANCYLHVDSTEKLKFQIISNDAGRSKWNLKGTHAVETNKWIWVIQAAIRYARDKKSGVLLNAKHINRSTPSLGRNPSVKSNDRNSRNSNAKSIMSNELKMNENLTQSGKSYVNKVIETRLEVPQESHSNKERFSVMETTSSSPTKAADVSSMSISSSRSNIVYEEGKNIDNYQEDEAISEEDEDGIDLKQGFNEEDLNMQYGPHSQEISMLQKTISLELNSVAKLLKSGTYNSESNRVVEKSMDSALSSFEKLNSLTTERENRFVSMLDKQRDVNSVWIQSVKDLEREMLEKTKRLESIDKERKQLKKVLQKKLQESAAASTRSIVSVDSKEEPGSTLDYVAKFINATKDENEDSDADEFFDAEESQEEGEEEHMQKAPATKEKEKVPVITLLPAETIPEKPIENHVPTVQPVSIEKELVSATPEVGTEVEPSVPVKPLEIEVPKEPVKIHAAGPISVPNVGPIISPVSSKAAELDISPRVSKELQRIVKEETTISVEKIAVNELQRKKESIMLKEGSFKGYEDGVRKRLKLDEDDRPSISLWSVLKSMVGKDMTRMTLPVSFNEPTSLLQRVAEDLEYSEIADHAAQFDDSTLRMLYVAAFAGSSYASTTKRVAKPFNPLLGETFEYVRPDKHYRFFAEQVSHHPPISATYTETPKWDFWGESWVDTKFTGRQFNVKHLGLWYLRMRPDSTGSEELYTWKKPNNTVIGILVGNPQVDNNGDVEITNHNTGDRCLLHFKARGWRSSGAYEVRGEVYNKAGKKTWVLGGHWNESFYAKKVTASGNAELSLEKTKTTSSATFHEPKFDGSVFQIWKAGKRPKAPFNLTPFAITLNALQPHLVSWLAPTDTRLRPDQRAMEDGEYDLAADEKHRLEEKQREAKREREDSNADYKPKWFINTVHPVTKMKYWKPKEDYWICRNNHDFKRCPDIF
ncbi:hypothetical protein Kpol_1045p52 [Vanderwaltozyma polyspora DSM 70294]|uniref:PH domain-containing protein n=1 Tax=Vanderwaltozyma polyspora (strain ATCC 22028 / DSM 70294 / BCRC 21397 / CBS 2163 / NBRC 10782 / NRRL Y-8283 / UCD 57-17) TaxID=436907 RepID=A7TI58_VANPO|nr:uncharacterized protein Kpol_1045p52 [Vanderwaltozyma polyspora DSM 70294]EDO18065.1 hypothetical protein Kpol_1045p52 [Vanderwaltozyma polyspora DSM 70294]